MLIKTVIELDHKSKEQLILELQQIGFDTKNIRMLQEYPFLGILYRNLKEK